MLAAYSPSLPRDNQWAKNKKNKHHGPSCRIPSNSHGQWMDGLDSNVSTATTGPSPNFVGFFLPSKWLNLGYLFLEFFFDDCKVSIGTFRYFYLDFFLAAHL